MSIKNILAVVPDTANAEAMIGPATALAEAHEAHLVILVVGALPALDYGYGGMAAGQLIVDEMTEVREDVEKTAAKLIERLAGTGVSVEVRSTAMSFAGISAEVARQGRYADLVLIGRSGGDGDGHGYLVEKALDGALFDSGRPVALIPPGWSNGFGRRITIAWDGSREASRAVAAAMPLIESADEIRIALAAPRVGDNEHGEEPGADLGTALARHSANVSVDRLPALGRKASEALLEHALDCDSDLLVLGGYGHSRLTETVFGGVTHDMIRHATLPLLMAH